MHAMEYSCRAQTRMPNVFYVHVLPVEVEFINSICKASGAQLGTDSYGCGSPIVATHTGILRVCGSSSSRKFYW